MRHSMNEIRQAYERWHGIKSSYKDGMYESMDVQAMYLIFRTGWLACLEAKENKK